MKRTLRAAAAVTALVLLSLFAPVRAPAQTPEEDAALRAATNLESPAEQIKAFKAFAAKYPQSKLLAAAHFLTTRALLAQKAPSKEIVDEARLTLQLVPTTQPDLLQFRVETALTVVEELAARKEMLDAAHELVAAVRAGLPDVPDVAPLRSVLALADAAVVDASGKRDEAVAAVRKILTEDPDNQAAQTTLAEWLVALGKTDEAIDAYVTAEAAYGGQQIDGAPLRDLYRKKHGGSLDGLDARLDVARKASLRRFALDSRRVDAEAPDWELQDLTGATVKLSALKGQVVVIDFWATWCGPCRAELPHIQALAGDFAGKNVRVLAVNVEGSEDAETWEKTVRSFVATNKYTFTVVNDMETKVHALYGIEALPTVFVVDKTGRIRYFNRGFEPTIREVLTTQIESLAN